MACNFYTGREIIMALKKASVWHTAVQCGANDGLLLTEGFSGAKAPNYVPDNSLGLDEIEDYYKTSESISDSFGGFLRYEGWDVPLALALGTAGNPSVVDGSAYGNTYSPASTICDLFATLAMKKSPNTEGVWEVPSASIGGFTISGRVGELAKITFNFMGNKIETDESKAVNGIATMASVTYPDKGHIATMDADFKMRMNAQSGSALADSDKIYPMGFTLTYNRPLEENFEASYADAAEPNQSDFATATLDLNFDKYNLDTFTSAVEDQTDFKLDLSFTGDIITGTTAYTFRVDIPKITWISAEAPVSGAGKIPHNISGRCQAVASAPTGMTGVTTPISIYVINTRTTDPLT